MSKNYEMVIGLEVHVQLNTKSKAFCGDENKFGEAANTLVSPVSLAHPGTLPRINGAQVEKAIGIGIALEGSINKVTQFDRKNYFYPDLPKGYQITQDVAPIVIGGEVQLKENNRRIRLHHIHLEEDAGKSIHDQHPEYTLIDLNRAGVPLLEIVTEPDFRSAEEVEEFMNILRHLVRWLDVSDGNMEEGSMRCDVNLSLRPVGQKEYGNRCEIKNLNSMRFAKDAIAYEFLRQEKLLNIGERIAQQTLNFSPETGKTTPLREKEDAHDYRYFSDPDLPPLVLTEDYINEIRMRSPVLPQILRAHWKKDLGLTEDMAEQLTATREKASFFETYVKESSDPKELAQLFINKIFPYSYEEGIALSDWNGSVTSTESFIKLFSGGTIAKSIAYQRLFPEWIKQPNGQALELAKRLDLLPNTDGSEIAKMVEDLIHKHPTEVASYRKGKKNLIGFFMGQLMRRSKGKLNPAEAKKLIEEALKADTD